jgi:succinoglycan biosynthesis transport protein ExoP
MTIRSNGGYEAMNTREATALNLRQLIHILLRRRKLIFISVGVAVGLAGIIWLLFAPRYTATAQIIVDPPRGSSGAGEPGNLGVLDDAAVQTHVAGLLSQGHLRRVFDSIVAERGPQPKEKRGVFGAEEFSIDTFALRINAFKDTRSRMIGITYTSTDPAFAASVANRSADLYLASLTERILGDRNEALRNQQLFDLYRQLAVARTDIAERNARRTTLSVGQTTNQSQMAEERSTPEARLRQLERRIAILKDASTEVREPEGQRELQREATAFTQLFDSLAQRQKVLLGEGNVQPDVRMLSSASIPNLPSSLNPLLFLPPAMVLALIGAGLVAVLLDQLDGSLRTEQDVTDALGIACIGSVPDPTHRKESWFRRLRFKILSPAGWTAIRQGISEKLSKAGKIQLRGRYSSRKPAGLPPHRLIPQDERYTEAIRSVVAAALQLADPHTSPKTLLVTSSVPGEGKTTLAISFAAYAARIGRRVLLIDLSFRHPSIASELGQPADDRILDGLQGTRPVAALIRSAPGLGFDYLPLSRNTADPIATLAGDRMPSLLRRLEGSYDCVVIDSAPLLSATEPRLLAPMVDKILLAVKWGSTPREVVQNALRLLRRSATGEEEPRNAIAAVITQVDLEKHARYRYGDFSENLLHLKSSPA